MKFFTATFFTALLLSLSTGLAQDASVVPIPDKVPSDPQPQPLPLASALPHPVFPHAGQYASTRGKAIPQGSGDHSSEVTGK